MVRAKSNLLRRRRYWHPVDQQLNVRCDQTFVLASPQTAAKYPEPLRRVGFRDTDQQHNFQFLINTFELPARRPHLRYLQGPSLRQFHASLPEQFRAQRSQPRLQLSQRVPQRYRQQFGHSRLTGPHSRLKQRVPAAQMLQQHLQHLHSAIPLQATFPSKCPETQGGQSGVDQAPKHDETHRTPIYRFRDQSHSDEYSNGKEHRTE